MVPIRSHLILPATSALVTEHDGTRGNIHIATEDDLERIKDLVVTHDACALDERCPQLKKDP